MKIHGHQHPGRAYHRAAVNFQISLSRHAAEASCIVSSCKLLGRGFTFCAALFEVIVIGVVYECGGLLPLDFCCCYQGTL